MYSREVQEEVLDLVKDRIDELFHECHDVMDQLIKTYDDEELAMRFIKEAIERELDEGR